MVYIRNIATLIAFALISCAINAQEVYESVDAEGNPEFSDSPTPGTKELKLQQPNIADFAQGTSISASTEQPSTQGNAAPESADNESDDEQSYGQEYVDGYDAERRERAAAAALDPAVNKDPVTREAAVDSDLNDHAEHNEATKHRAR